MWMILALAAVAGAIYAWPFDETWFSGTTKGVAICTKRASEDKAVSEHIAKTLCVQKHQSLIRQAETIKGQATLYREFDKLRFIGRVENQTKTMVITAFAVTITPDGQHSVEHTIEDVWIEPGQMVPVQAFIPYGNIENVTNQNGGVKFEWSVLRSEGIKIAY